MRHVLSLVLLAGLASACPAQSFNDAVRSVATTVVPSTAAPGQTVTVKLTIELNDGWHTYPVTQTDPGAKSFASKIAFPTDGPLVFVGKLKEPAGVKSKAEPELGIEKLLYYEGTITWERTAVVAPSTPAGPATVTLTPKFQVCTGSNCLPPKSLKAAAALVVAGAPVAVDPAHAAEVEKSKR